MKGDFTRFTFNAAKRYSSVRMQQGRMQLDADWNEQVQIQAHRERTENRDVVGPSGAPENGGGFQVKAGDNGELTLSAGRFYVDGILCENDREISPAEQDDLPGVALPKGDGLHIAYLDVWEHHVTALEDPAIREVGLGGPDTATRTRVVWQVKLLPLETVPEGADEPPEWQALTAAPTGRLSASWQGGVPRENRLYRIEIHDGGAPGTATFKWSRSNAWRAARLETIDGDRVRLGEVGGGGSMEIAPGDWVEISDTARSLRGEPGVMVEVLDFDEDALAVRGWPGGKAMKRADFGSQAMVREWDSAGTVVVDEGGPLQLEDGLEIRFEDGDYRSGDYWLVPVRAARPELGLSAARPPHGIRRHFSRLALVERREGAFEVREDSRRLFSPLTDQAGSAGVAREIYQPGHGFAVGQAIRYDAAANRYALARADDEGTTGMFLVAAVRNRNRFTLFQAGYVEGLSGLVPGEYYFVSDQEPGGLTSEEPTFGMSNPVLYADSEAGGYVLPWRPSQPSPEPRIGVPVGAVLPFATETPPASWLECNGQEVGRAQYAALFEVISTRFGAGNGSTTFRVPDLRGMFVRGWAHGSENDPDRNRRVGSAGGASGDHVGSSQADQFQGHKHFDRGHGHGLSTTSQTPNSVPATGNSWVGQPNISVGEGRAVLTDPVKSNYGEPRFGRETRPSNIALMYCIKA